MNNQSQAQLVQEIVSKLNVSLSRNIDQKLTPELAQGVLTLFEASVTKTIAAYIINEQMAVKQNQNPDVDTSEGGAHE